MTSESKILTVSYGTFSCTLEGFDDPFNTMKAIAEYFRDLAADDRYFGAEPPQPDAAMLHRIAEREVTRIVDSRVGDNAVTLRQQAGSGDLAPMGRVTTERRVSRDLAEAAQAATGTMPEETSPEPTLQDVIPNGVAAKLARIRQSVNPPFVPAAVAEAALEAMAGGEVPSVDGEVAYAAPEAGVTAPEAEDVLSRLGTLMTDPSADTEESDLAAASDADADAADIDNAFGDVFEADAAPMVEDAEELADDTVEAQVESWLLQADEPAEVEAVPSETALDVTVEAEAGEDISDEMTVAAQDLAEELLGAAPAATPPEEAFSAAEALSPEAQDLQPEAAPADDLPLTEALAADPLPEEIAPEAEADPAPVAAAPATPATGKTAAKTKRVSSRVVRIHPDDDGDAAPAAERPDPNATRLLDPGADEDFARLLRQADDVMSDEDNRRRLESIAHLKAAVAATEADRAAGTEAKPAPETREDAYRDDLAHVVVPPEPEPAPAPEVRPRRKTISVRPQEPRPGTIRPGMVSPPPLVLVSEQRIDRVAPAAPAPVSAPAAATVPAAAPVHAYAPTHAPEGQPMVALRTGRLTGAIGAAAASPVAPQQKLVLEQPSRATSTEPDDEEDLHDELSEIDEAGLVRFAEQVGVKSMADMLEAAAAYATCIEKRSQFTRPQLMRRLMASAGGKPVSREDGLRSFGTLLRTGRIEKVNRGFYVLAEHSPYLAEARRLS